MRLVVFLIFLLSATAFSQELPIAKEGETVAGMAQRIGVDAKELAKRNGLLPGAVLKDGRRLSLWCDMSLDKAPVVRGLRLGMTELEAEKVLGGDLTFLVDHDEGTRSSSVLVNRIEGFEGIGFVTIDSFDSKIFRIRISYDSSVKWKNVEELVDNFGPKLGLPAAWKEENWGMALIACKDFDARLTMILGGSLELIDKTAVRLIAKERTKAEEARKISAKP